MFKTEESRISVIILLTFAMLLLTGIYPEYVLWLTAALIGLILVLGIYAIMTKKKGEPQDERSARGSLMASRNGFVIAIVLTALLAVAVKLEAPITIGDMIQMVWGMSMATYFLSYLYYKRVA